MTKKDITELACSLDPISYHFGPMRDRRRNWLIALHTEGNLLGICSAMPTVKVAFGDNLKIRNYESVLVSERNVITVSKLIAENNNEKEIKAIILHEIKHSKMSFWVEDLQERQTKL